MLLRSALRKDIFAQFTEISLPGLGFSALTLFLPAGGMERERAPASSSFRRWGTAG